MKEQGVIRALCVDGGARVCAIRQGSSGVRDRAFHRRRISPLQAARPRRNIGCADVPPQFGGAL